ALRRNTDVDVIRTDVLRRHGHRADHTLLVHVHAGQHRGVVGDAYAVVDSGDGIRHVPLLDDAVRVAIDVRVVADRDAVAELNAAAVVEENVSVDDDVVAN